MRVWLVAAMLVGCAAPTPDYRVAHERGEAPAWAIPYGREHWLAQPQQIDLDRVQHAIRDLRVEDPRFTASYRDGELVLAPREGAPVALRTTRIELGERVLDGERAWAILGNTAQRRWGEVIEHHAITADGAELAWVLTAPVHEAWLVELDAKGLAAPLGVGAAALVDARGQRFAIETEREGDTLRWRVPGELLARAAYPVALDPLVGPELGSDHPMHGTTPESGDAAFAWDGTQWLSVWYSANAQAIHATRLDASGAILDPAGIVIDADDADLAVRPAVASNGQDFFVVWERGAADITATRVFGTRVAPSGQAAQAIALSTSALDDGDSAGVGVASNGIDYTAVWTESDGAHYIVPSSGAGGAIAPPGDGLAVSRPAIAFDGADYLVAWRQDSSTMGARITAAGATSPFMLLQNGADPPTLASNGTTTLVAANDPNTGQLEGARVSATGAILDATPIEIGATGLHHDIASAGGDYLVAWERGTCQAVRIAGTGAILDATPIAFAGDTCAAAAGNGGYLVAWDGANGLAGARVSTAGGIGATLPLATADTNHQRGPAVASNGQTYLVVWSDTRETGDVVATRISASGEILDVDGIVLATNVSPPLAVASNNTDYLVAWSAGGDVVARHVSADGNVGPQLAIASGTASLPVASSTGGSYLVAWRDARADQPGIYASVVSDSVATAAAIAVPTGDIATPNAIATNGTEYMLAWSRTNGIGATVIGSNGARKGADIEFPAGSDPSIASDLSAFLVIWNGGGSAAFSRVTATGQNLDPDGLALGLQGSTRIALDHFAYLVVSSQVEIDGLRLLSTGMTVDTFPISPQGTAPAVVGAPGLPTLVAYEDRGRVTARQIVESCGDRFIDPGEACDDGNTASGDGCSAACVVETGFVCDGNPSICSPVMPAICGEAACDANATCDTDGFLCFCNAGFTGDGMTCTSNDDGCGCNAHGNAPPILLAILLLLRRRAAASRG